MFEWTKHRHGSGRDIGSSAIDWYDRLRDFGVDVDNALPETQDRINLAEALEHARPAEALDIDSVKQILSGQLGQGKINVDQAVEKLSAAAGYEVVKQNAREVVGQAVEIAYNHIATSMKNLPDDYLVGLLRPVIERQVAEFRVAVEAIPGDVYTKKIAQSRGRDIEKAWLSCEDILDVVYDVHRLADEWRMDRVLSVAGNDGETNYSPEDFQWENVRSMDGPMRNGDQREDVVSWFRRMLPHGPTILTVAEVDEYRTTQPAPVAQTV